MRLIKKLAAALVAAILSLTLTAGGAFANGLSVTWAFLFPVPIPVPVWTVDHPRSLFTFGFLFPFWLPLPLYEYDDSGPIEPFSAADVPGDAVVYIDGAAIGTVADVSPDALDALPDGEHEVTLTHEGDTLYAAVIGVEAGKVVSVKGADALD